MSVDRQGSDEDIDESGAVVGHHRVISGWHEQVRNARLDALIRP